MQRAQVDRRLRRFALAGERMGLASQPIVHQGWLRPCLVYAPPGTTAPSPLVLALHPGAGNPLSMARLTRFHEIAAREKFIVAYPGGAGPLFRHRTWNAGGAHVDGWAETNRIDDVGFLRMLIDDLANDFPVDRLRVYAVGMSKGAMMAYRLAFEASDMIAAIAAVAGPMCVDDEKTPSPVSVVHIHGARDENVPFKGGRGRRTRRGASWPSSEAGLDYWRRANECREDRSEAISDRGVFRRRSLGAGGSEVELLLLEDRRHEWPHPRPALIRRLLGSAPKDGIDASEEIWRFLCDKQLTR